MKKRIKVMILTIASCAMFTMFDTLTAEELKAPEEPIDISYIQEEEQYNEELYVQLPNK